MKICYRPPANALIRSLKTALEIMLKDPLNYILEYINRNEAIWKISNVQDPTMEYLTALLLNGDSIYFTE